MPFIPTCRQTCRQACSRTCCRVILAAALLLLGSCASIPEPGNDTGDEAARALFAATADAHGRAAFETLQDIAVSYEGQWYKLVQKLQGVLVDPDYRKRSQERLLIAADVTAQVHTGPAGEKVVLRERGGNEETFKADTADVSVQYNGVRDGREPVRNAAALVADAYRMFLLGPLHFLGREVQLETLAPVQLDGRLTDRLRVRTRPGLGASAQDDYVLYIDRRDRLTRRIRFTLEGLASTRGAIVETDLSDYIERDGLQLPTRFFERIRRPIPRLKAHRWHMTGLDLNRGLIRDEVSRSGFSGRAAPPARALEPLR